MSRAPRIDVADQVYHIINRANGRQVIFHTADDYRHFEFLLKEACERTGMRMFAYVVMPNHWHLIVYPRNDGDLSSFMQWLTLTHTQQHHAKNNTAGYGHLYQGRYKSFLIEKDTYLLAAIKYVERNPVRAKLATSVEAWRWGSGYRRIEGTPEERRILSLAPLELPDEYPQWVNQPDEEDDLNVVRESVNKGKPFGPISWTERMVGRFKLELTMRTPGRPKKK